MAGSPAAQSIALESLPAVLGTALIGAVFYGITAHVAARYVLGDVRIEQGLVVGAVPAIVLVAGSQLAGTGGVQALVVALALVGDYLAIYRIYDLDRRRAGVVTLVHYAVSVLLGVVLVSLLG